MYTVYGKTIHNTQDTKHAPVWVNYLLVNYYTKYILDGMVSVRIYDIYSDAENISYDTALQAYDKEE